MRVGLWRWVICVAVIVSAIAVGTAADPPTATEKKNGTKDPAVERAELQAELIATLKKMAAASSNPMTYPSGPGTGTGIDKKPKVDPVYSGAKGPDPIREGINYFRDNDFEAAKRTFQLIEPSSLLKEDRAFTKYMLACCLRRQGKQSEAEFIYREVANSGDDEFLASCAVWQLSLIRSEQELQAQLEQLRARAKSK